MRFGQDAHPADIEPQCLDLFEPGTRIIFPYPGNQPGVLFPQRQPGSSIKQVATRLVDAYFAFGSNDVLPAQLAEEQVFWCISHRNIIRDNR